MGRGRADKGILMDGPGFRGWKPSGVEAITLSFALLELRFLAGTNPPDLAKLRA
jgi:hypothetical protein